MGARIAQSAVYGSNPEENECNQQTRRAEKGTKSIGVVLSHTFIDELIT